MRQQETILVADDEAQIRGIIARVLEAEGMRVLQAADGGQAMEIISSTPLDLIILDVMMDGLDGFSVLRETRQDGIRTPVFILSARDQDQDAVFGLSIGADDYITKPFSPTVLCAKVKALLRRVRAHPAQARADSGLELGIFRFDPSSLKMYKNGREVPLTAKETRMMKLFMEHPYQVFTKDMLYSRVWNEEIVDDNTIMVYIRHLRTKLEDDPKNPRYIKTVWGTGYQFTPGES